MDDLRVFETVEEITGVLNVMPEAKLPELTSLDIFRNLRKVGGTGAEDNRNFAVAIVSSHLTSFGMINFREVSRYYVFFQTPKMCYIDKNTLQGMLRDINPSLLWMGAGAFEAPDKCGKKKRVNF